MAGLTLKRFIVIVISQVLGILVAMAIIGPVFDNLRFVSAIQTPQGRDIATYGGQYFLWTFVPIGIVFMIWIDKFADTKILPD